MTAPHTLALALSGLIVTTMASPGHAQDGGWKYTSTAYLWISGTTLSFDSPAGPVETDVSFGDSLADLDYGLIVAGGASRGPWTIFGDLMYTKSTAGDAFTGGPEFSEVDTKTKSTFLALGVTYDVFHDDDLTVQLGGGLRYVRLDSETTLVGGTSPSQTTSSLDEWAEPLVVARLRQQFSPEWFGVLYGDAGMNTGGDAGSTWQALATVGYSLNERSNIQVGWRYLDVETNNPANVRMQLSGPIIGFNKRF